MYQRSLEVMASENQLGEFEHYLAVDSEKDGYEFEKSIYDDRINVNGNGKRALLREMLLSKGINIVFFRIRQNQQVPEKNSPVPCSVYIASNDDTATARLEEELHRILGNGAHN